LDTSESRTNLRAKFSNAVQEKMEKISWTDRVRNEVLHRVKKAEYPTKNKKERVTELITSFTEPAF
jgi:vacuolar-type H+-ATPase subunit I/STV1